MENFNGAYLRTVMRRNGVYKLDLASYLKVSIKTVDQLVSGNSYYGGIYDHDLRRLFFPNEPHSPRYILCVKPHAATNPPAQSPIIAPPVILSDLPRRTPKDTRFSYSETMLSVGDIPLRSLTNTGSSLYKRLTTWLDVV